MDKDDDSDDDGEEGLAGRRVPRYHQLVGDDEDGEKEGEEGEGRGVDDEEDERYLRQMDVFEAKYNFRWAVLVSVALCKQLVCCRGYPKLLWNAQKRSMRDPSCRADPVLCWCGVGV